MFNKNTFYLILFFSTAVFFSLSAQIREDRMYWAKDRKLSWDDFKGTPNNYVRLGAITTSSLQSSFSFKGDTVTFIAQSFMQPYKSWVKKESKSSELLSHEQLHFDITELYVRKLKHELNQMELKRHIIRIEFDRISSENRKQWDIAQEQYDKESEHSMNKDKQQEWEQKIAKELKELESYSADKIVKPLVKRAGDRAE